MAERLKKSRDQGRRRRSEKRGKDFTTELAEEPPRKRRLEEPWCHGSGLVEVAVEEAGNGADFDQEFGELGRDYGLDAVGEGFFGLVMYFDEEAVGTCGYGGARHGKNFVAFAGAVAGVDEYGEMAAFFDGGNYSEVESVAREIGEGAHAAFAQHHVVVAFGEDVFRGHEEFVERSGHAAFEEHGSFGAAGAFE